MDDHYFGAIRERIASYMKDVNKELWKLGVSVKTQHNEVAPAQHELAPIFTTTNVASDHNQLMMEFMKRVALRHGLVCLLHEKPFDGVNGSGKHNNWSLSTEEGLNLLDPGKEPYKNLRFLTFLAAIIKAVDEYQDLLRVSVASAGNDHRLGANEAPPAIVSMFLGTELTAVLEAIAADKVYNGNPESCNRYTFAYENPAAGEGHFIHTYKCDGNPLPSFEGEPKLIAIPDDMDAFADSLWNSLNADNKVSLFVRYIDIATGTYETKIINKNQ